MLVATASWRNCAVAKELLQNEVPQSGVPSEYLQTYISRFLLTSYIGLTYNAVPLWLQQVGVPLRVLYSYCIRSSCQSSCRVSSEYLQRYSNLDDNLDVYTSVRLLLHTQSFSSSNVTLFWELAIARLVTEWHTEAYHNKPFSAQFGCKWLSFPT